MGFGGGGSGSFVLPNHTHSSAVEDGGILSTTLTELGSGILLQTTPIEELDNHTNTAVNTYTFTPTAPLSWADYEYFILMARFVSGGGGNMQLTFNSAKAQGWRYSGRTISTAAAEVLIGATAQATAAIGDFGANGERVNVWVKITRGGNVDSVAYFESICTNQTLDRRISGMNLGAVGTATDFTNITISNTGVAWQALGDIRILGVRKT
jgi:hypothetical protein